MSLLSISTKTTSQKKVSIELSSQSMLGEKTATVRTQVAIEDGH